MMYSKEYIVKNGVFANKGKVAGIYFLIWRKEIVYVGSAIDVHNRFKSHRKDKTFDSYYIIPCENIEFMRYEETEYIRAFCPKYNKKDNPMVVQKAFGKEIDPFEFKNEGFVNDKLRIPKSGNGFLHDLKKWDFETHSCHAEDCDCIFEEGEHFRICVEVGENCRKKSNAVASKGMEEDARGGGAHSDGVGRGFGFEIQFMPSALMERGKAKLIIHPDDVPEKYKTK